MASFRKGFIIPLLLTIIAALILGGGAYYYVQKLKPSIVSTVGTGTSFVKVGDSLGTMKVVSVNPFNSEQYASDSESIKIGPNNAKVILKGPILVTGTYHFINSGVGFSGYCMSNFDVASLSRLPSLPGVSHGDAGYTFCFRNEDFAKQKLGEKSRIVTVKIDNYELNSYPSEVIDWADLVGVLASDSTSQDEAAGWKTYTNTQYGFEFKLNPDWEMKYFINDPSGVTQTRVSEPSNVANYIRVGSCCSISIGEVPRISKKIIGWNESLVSQTSTDVGGMAAEDIISVIEDTKFRTVTAFRPKVGGGYYKFTFSHNQESSKTLQTPELDSIISTFKFAPTAPVLSEVSTNNEPPFITSIDGPTNLAVGQEGRWSVLASNASEFAVMWRDGTDPVYDIGTYSGLLPYKAVFVPASTFTHTFGKPGTYDVAFFAGNKNRANHSRGLMIKVSETGQELLTVNGLKNIKDTDSTQLLTFGWYPTLLYPTQVPSSWSGYLTSSGCDNPSPQNASRPWTPMSLVSNQNVLDFLGQRTGYYKVVFGEIWSGCSIKVEYKGADASGRLLQDSVTIAFKNKFVAPNSVQNVTARLTVNGQGSLNDAEYTFNGQTILNNVDYTLPLNHYWDSEGGTYWLGRLTLMNCNQSGFYKAFFLLNNEDWLSWPKSISQNFPTGYITITGDEKKGTSVFTPGPEWRGCTATWTYKVSNNSGASKESLVQVTFKNL